MQQQANTLNIKKTIGTLTFVRGTANESAHELLSFTKRNNIIHNLFEWLTSHDELQHGATAEVIKLYNDNVLVGLAWIENFEARTDKFTKFNNTIYQDLGLVHYAVDLEHRNKGYGSLLADQMHEKIVKPLLSRYNDYAFILATGRAYKLISRTGVNMARVVPDFYSEKTFERKVVNLLNTNVIQLKDK